MAKRVMVVFAHPLEESFSAALHTTVLQGLDEGGWEIDDCDLYAEGFEPVMSADERRNYHTLGSNIDPVSTYVERLRAADALVFVFPVWNFGYPAILKGFFDRVFLPGVSFKLVDGKVRPNLTHIKRAATVTTYGGTYMRALLAGDPPRRQLKRSVRYVLGGAPMEYLALYDMNRISHEKRASFLHRVSLEMRGF
ncbi:MAG: NAD(P)H-dependent oxidoreductase [Pseudomonadota bacterium]